MADASQRLRVDGSRADPPSRDERGAGSRFSSVNRRDRLRDFQTGLADKLRRAQGTPLAVNRLGVQVGTHRLLIDLADAGEILAVPDVTPVPLTKEWYRGLANVRGNLLGVVDLSLFAGASATPLDKESRLLAFSGELRFSTGILVSRMLGLRSAADLVLDPAADKEPPSPFAPWLRACHIDAQDIRWQEIDLVALTVDPRFLDIAR
jgi:twitching motility protein PilI